MNIKLEQLRIFKAVVDHGGANNAAAAIHKSPSAVSHALSALQDQLGIDLFETQGRQLVITSKGTSLLAYAEQLLEDQQALIDAAKRLTTAQQESLTIAVDAIYPQDKLFSVLGKITQDKPWCKIRVEEHVLSGIEEAVTSGHADIGIAYRVPDGHVGKAIIQIPFVTVAAPNHPLSKLENLSLRDLKRHRQVVISDSGKQSINSGWLNQQHRWTTSSIHSALNMAKSGLAYARLPIHIVEQDLKSGELSPLNLAFDFEKLETLFGFSADPSNKLHQEVIDLLKE